MDIYHALNRGVDKRTIFLDRQDFLRFVHDMYEFNDARPADNVRHHMKNTDLRSRYFERKPIVDIHGWVLMKNHYHLLLSERVEGGITLFLRKLNIGYAKYFNERYKRVGTLFQGRTKKILIENDQQFNYILYYIHLNPLDYLKGAEQWRIRDKGLFKAADRALLYLQKYRWSSYLDYCGEKNFPSILTTTLFQEGGGPKEYRKSIAQYLKNIESDSILSLALE